MGIEYIEYLFGGFLYLISPSFREKKLREWKCKSAMHKIYEVGMWVSIPFFTFCLITVLRVSK